jgi:Fe-S cluster biogenesis protein NfuA
MLSNEKIVEQIEEALEELRPYFFMHGGNISLVKFEDGKVYVKLEGNCSGCSSSSYTLKLLIEDTLKREVPQVKEVVEQK